MALSPHLECLASSWLEDLHDEFEVVQGVLEVGDVGVLIEVQ